MARTPSLISTVAVTIIRNYNLRSLISFVGGTFLISRYYSCSAFQHRQHWNSVGSISISISSSHFHNHRKAAPLAKPTMTRMSTAPENKDSWTETMATVADDCVNGDSSQSVGGRTDAFKSLKQYIESISNDNETPGDTFTCRLIPSITGNLSQKHSREEIASLYYTKGRNNATIIEINTLVFRPIVADDEPNSHGVYAVAIVPSSDRVDIRAFSEELFRLQQSRNKDQYSEGGEEEGANGGKQCRDSRDADCYQKWELAPSHLVQDLCGFSPGSVPPLLVPPKNGSNGSSRSVNDEKKPLGVIIDSSLLRSPNANKTINIHELDSKLLLLGGGGNTDYQCLIDAEFLMERVFEMNTGDNSSNRNAKVACIIRFEGGMTTNETTRTKWPSDAKLSDSSNNENKKPFFQIAPPSSSMDYYTMAQSEPKRPHRPVPVTAIGRLTSVRQVAKRLIFADFAPPDYDYSSWLTCKNAPRDDRLKPNYDKTPDGMPGPPWRSGEDGKDMYVQIIVGKTFCERYDDGTERLKSLKPGKLVLVKGAANVDPMQKNGWRNSAGNWAQKRSLDVIVSSFEILDENEDDSLRLLVEEAQKERSSVENWNSLLPWERKRGYEQRAVAGNNGFTNGSIAKESGRDDPSLPSPSQNNRTTEDLTFNEFNSYFRDSPLQIEIVSSDDSIKAMANEISELFSRINMDTDENTSFLEYSAGIDCEWRPTGAYAEALLEGPDDNSVALLQICIPAIGKVYLVDTHVTLRSSLADTEEMTSREEILSKAIGTLFGSERMIKVGYSVVIDFRRLAASFPHIPAFRNVRSVVELSTLAQRLHPKSARPSLGSLQRLTRLVLGYSITKEQQCSNWEARPLTSNQVEYAALDCALPPRLLDQMTEGSGTAKMKEVLPSIITSWRFQTLDSDQKDAIQLLKATRVVGNTFVVSQSWLQRAVAPVAVSMPKEGGGPYVDSSGILKMPANLVSVAGEGEHALWRKMAGKTVGKSKAKCIDLLVGDTLPEGANLQYNPRSGFITFKDGLALFVNMPDPKGSSRRMPYPNEWLEDGRILTWYIRPKDWDDSRSKTAKLLLGLGDADSEGADTSVVLFTRIGNSEFVCCGHCKASVPNDPKAGPSSKKLVKLNLRLEDWDMMKNRTAFTELLEAKKAGNNESVRQVEVFDPAPFRNLLARMVLDGNIIGAFGIALDKANVSSTERSVATGVDCVKSYLSNSDDPLVLQAMTVIEDMI